MHINQIWNYPLSSSPRLAHHALAAAKSTRAAAVHGSILGKEGAKPKLSRRRLLVIDDLAATVRNETLTGKGGDGKERNGAKATERGWVRDGG